MDDETRLAEAPGRGTTAAASDSRPSSGSSGWLSSSGAIDHGRFPPGTLLGGRYRIVGRLGRGGMGEVYRADDLKLGQPVALKFLAPEVDRDPGRLTQLHTEVRMARQVSHPNVCRVYDIDEVDGHTFLSMEYVDGEDLASLLRRIGRFAADRALEIGRQLCAGLAAAHERGVVHRDFKPANVMLDGAGKVRITDFGLAGASGEGIRAGTPAYMAPEQLAGGEVTARSDIYALGLVLYEIFTGQRALEGKNLAELIRKREQSGIVGPSTLVRDLDPEIDAAIMRCLRPEPEQRPASALLVAASLPGGDPLAAALAAGETPSPAMVAASGRDAALHPAIGVGMFVFILAGLLLFAGMADRQLLVAHVPLSKPLAVLEDRARELAAAVGYAQTNASATGLYFDYDFISQVQRTDRSATRWDALRTGDYPVIGFWYRGSGSPMVPLSRNWDPSPRDPALDVPGMVAVTLDQQGRLLQFVGVPPRYSAAPSAAQPTDWRPLFAAADLDMANFTPAGPDAVPPVYADERIGWEGHHRERPQIRLRIDAGAVARQPVFFKVSGPWTARNPAPPRPVSAGRRVLNVTTAALTFLMLCGTLLLARNNLQAGRGDVRGATRIAIATLIVWIAAWGFGATHYADLSVEGGRFFTFLGPVLTNSAILWLAYVALEPHVRRLWPVILISWTRILEGRVLDPRIGRDVLVGLAVGVAVAAVGLSWAFVAQWMNGVPGTPRSTNVQFLRGNGPLVGALLRMLPNALQNAMLMSFVFVIARTLLRNSWLAVLATALVLGLYVLTEAGGDAPLLSVLLVSAVFVIPIVATLLLFGLFAQALAFLVNQALNNSPLTLDLSNPHAPASLFVTFGTPG